MISLVLHQVKKLLESHDSMSIPNNLPPNEYTRLTFSFSEWNGCLEIRVMRKDIRDIKDLIVNGNPAEKEDEYTALSSLNLTMSFSQGDLHRLTDAKSVNNKWISIPPRRKWLIMTSRNFKFYTLLI